MIVLRTSTPEIEEKVRTNPNGDLHEITDELGIEVCAVIRNWVNGPNPGPVCLVGNG